MNYNIDMLRRICIILFALFSLDLGLQTEAIADIQGDYELADSEAFADLRLAVDFFGTEVRLSMQLPSPPTTTLDPEKIFLENRQQLARTGRILGRLFRQLQLDSYGKLQLATQTLNNLSIAIHHEDKLQTVTRGLVRNSWNQSSYNLALAALLAESGLKAVPLHGSDGQLYIGLEVGEQHMQGLFFRITDGSRKLRFQIWNGQSRVGDFEEGLQISNFLTSSTLFSTEKQFTFLKRQLPDQIKPISLTKQLSLYGLHTVLRIPELPEAASYLKNAPELYFENEFANARKEIKKLGLAQELRQVRRRVPSEEDFVNLLLRSIQNHFTYREGPLRNVLTVLDSGYGDCDELSLLLATLLTEAGYSPDDIKAVRWAGHLALAIRPKTQGPKSGSFLTIRGDQYYLLDSTFFQKGADQSNLSQWGVIPEGLDRDVEIVDLGG